MVRSALALSLIASALCAETPGERRTITARQVVDLIHQHLGVPVKTPTVDTFKAGNPDTPVTGIAVTMMATFDVLQRAVAEGANFVITHEPTFYNHLDTTTDLERRGDAVLAAKQKFISDHGLVIWRFHDGWHAHRPDGILAGMTQALGWEKYRDPASDRLFSHPAISIEDLAREVKEKLGIHTLRIVGNPELTITRVAFLPGAAGSARQIELLERSDVEALLIGEVPEWETVEYVADASTQSKPKALILLGHIPSEQAGMEACSRWLNTFLQDVPINFVPTREFFGLVH